MKNNIIMNDFKRAVTSGIFVLSLLYVNSSFSAEYVDDAKKFMEKGNYSSAIIQLKNQLKEYPDDAMARYYLGTSYLELWKIEPAFKELKRAYKLNPENADIKLSYAKVLLVKKEYAKILTILSRKMTEPLKEQRREIYRAYAYLGQNKIADAKQILSALNVNNNGEVFNAQAKIALLENDIKTAEKRVKQSLQQDPENFDALQLQARIYIVKEQFKEAIEVYNKLIEKRPGDLRLLLKRAALKFNQDDLKGAEEDLHIVLSKIKNQPHANYLLARIKLKEEKYKKVQEISENILNLIPRHYESMLMLGIAHFKQGNYNQADKYLTQYISANPENIKAQILLANIYLIQENPEQALLILEDFDEKTINNNVDILNAMGSAYLMAGDYKKSIEVLNKAKQLAPDDINIQKKLITSLYKKGDIDSVTHELEKISGSIKDKRKLNHLLVLTYIQQKQLDKADKKLTELLQSNPNDAVLYNLKAYVERLKGNFKRSKENYQQALKIDNAFIPAYYGLAELAIEEKNWDTAKANFIKITQIKPKYIKAYIKLAQIAEKEKKPDEIESWLKKGYTEVKGDIKSQIYMANMLSKWYLKQNTPEKILLLANELNREYPDENRTLSFLAAAQMANNKNSEAEKTLRLLIGKINNDVKHRVLLAVLLIKKNSDSNYILGLLDEAIQFAPNNPKPMMVKINYLFKLKQFDKVLKTADDFIESFPEQAFGYQAQGNAYLKKNEPEKALSSYQMAYKLRPSLTLLFDIADILNSQGNIKEAVTSLKNALNKSNNDLAIYFKLANIYQKNRQYNQAIKYYKKMLEIKKDSTLALNNLAWVYFQQSLPDALPTAERAYKISPDAPEIMDTYGYFQVKLGDIGKGVELLEKASRSLPNDSNIKYHLAEAYFLQGKKAKAKTILQAILSQNNFFSERENAQALFNTLQ